MLVTGSTACVCCVHAVEAITKQREALKTGTLQDEEELKTMINKLTGRLQGSAPARRSYAGYCLQYIDRVAVGVLDWCTPCMCCYNLQAQPGMCAGCAHSCSACPACICPITTEGPSCGGGTLGCTGVDSSYEFKVMLAINHLLASTCMEFEGNPKLALKFIEKQGVDDDADFARACTIGIHNGNSRVPPLHDGASLVVACIC